LEKVKTNKWFACMKRTLLSKLINPYGSYTIFRRLENISLKEIEAKLDRFKLCPKCSSSEGFWLGVSHSHPYVQCKTCGVKFELFEIFRMDHKDKTLQKVEIFRR
jgi:hypothetical protein